MPAIIVKLLLLLLSLANPLWLLALVPLLIRWRVGGTHQVAALVGTVLVGLAVVSRVIGLVSGGSATTAVIMWLAGNGLFVWGYAKAPRTQITNRLIGPHLGLNAGFVLLLLLA